MTRSVQEWTVHWDSRAVIDDPIEASGYCVAGVAVDAETYRSAVLEPWLDRLQLEPQHHVLDVGCGCGLLLEQLASRAQRAVGTDVSQEQLRRYRGSAETYVCAADDLPFAPEQFDRIAMVSVAQYFPSLTYFEAVVTALVTLLRAPGVLLIGDVLLGTAPSSTRYRWYDPSELTTILGRLPVRFGIEAQPAPKRAINHRHDVLVFKDG